MSNFNNADIAILYPSSFSVYQENSLFKDIEDSNLKLLKKKESMRISAGIDWVIPGLVAIFFGGFLGEAGKDLYVLSKKVIFNGLKLGKEMSLNTFSSSKRVNKSDTQSKAISVHIKLKNEKSLKLLFDNDLTLKDWIDASDLMMDMVFNQSKDFPNDELTSKMISFKNNDEIYAYINKETKKWEFIDINTIIQQRIKQQKLDSNEDKDLKTQ